MIVRSNKTFLFKGYDLIDKMIPFYPYAEGRSTMLLLGRAGGSHWLNLFPLILPVTIPALEDEERDCPESVSPRSSGAKKS